MSKKSKDTSKYYTPYQERTWEQICNAHVDECSLTVGKCIGAIIMGVLIGLFAPAGLVYAFFFLSGAGSKD